MPFSLKFDSVEFENGVTPQGKQPLPNTAVMPFSSTSGLTFTLLRGDVRSLPSLPSLPSIPPSIPQSTGVVRNRLRLPNSTQIQPIQKTATGEPASMSPGTSANVDSGKSAEYSQADDDKCSRADDAENDQYDTGSQNVCIAVLCHNDRGIKNKKSLIGQYGHVERLSSWIHLIGFALFAIYAAVRHSWGEHGLSQYLTTFSAVALALCFLASTVYHTTSPSKRLAYFTRQFDYFGIYLSISACCVADLCIATRGFSNTPYLAILDVPLAAIVTFTFFIVRRVMLPADESWSTYLGQCTLFFGLMKRGHVDVAHAATRQATSLLLTIGYFAGQAASFETFGVETASILLGVEVAGLLIVIFGMSLDTLFVWPDSYLARGKGPRWMVCTGCGCVANGHALWHILSVIVAIKGALAREYALSIL